MKILVINCGSSSIKYKLYDMTSEEVLASGIVDKVGIEGAHIKYKLPNGESKIIEAPVPTHTEGIRLMFDVLLSDEVGAIKSLDEVQAVGHRIVHGGTFTKSLLVTPEVIEEWKTFMDLAPLHNPAHLKGYNAVKEQLPNMPQVFVFDTSFHQTMPEHAYMYALPYKYYTNYNIRRYGAHGTSHRFVTQRVGEFLGIDPAEKKIITCHIGNGASISAVDHGKCVDTSMGLTPLEGLMMGTRTGDIDSSAILYIMKKEGLSIDEANDLLNKKSGMLGITEISSDMRAIEEANAKGDPRARLGTDMYTYRIKKYIGAYAAAMGGVDIIVFTAGVAENQYDIRQDALKGLEFLGVDLDVEFNKNPGRGKDVVISKPESRVTVAIIPTDEELLIARDTKHLVQG
ncbi:MAG: acetate kinase [Alloprevotella sp.]|nr:acetate kinase [Bacteroidales bacterium]MDY3942822.1 acetate kinase [Alloprevotella sp.]